MFKKHKRSVIAIARPYMKTIATACIALGMQGARAQDHHGALAIDKSDGLFFGWAVDYKNQLDADNRALKECADRGGNCSIVLRFEGEVCAEYRTLSEDVGTAYGWGVAKTESEASSIAQSECEKRSNGVPCTHYVWGCNSANNEKEIETDDFWSGKKETKNSNEAHDAETDDFWSGGQAKPKDEQNNQNDFWTGKGSQKEEDYFDTHTQPKESNQFIGEINSKTKYIKIVCRDHGDEDGDRVALLNNKAVVKSNIYLTNAPKTFRIELQWGMNRIDFKALNTGSAGPNTAKFDVYDDTGKLVSSKEWNLLTGFIGTLLITKF